MPRAFGYIRHVFGQGAESVQAQRQSILDYFESRLKPEGFTWGRFFEDGAVSGKRELRSRPAGFDLNLKLEAGDAVVFATVAAFRNSRNLMQVINRWTARSVTAHVLDVKLDFSTDMGKHTLGMLEFGADIKRFIYSERMKESIACRKSEGRPTSGKAPYGLKCIGPRGNRRYAPDPFTRRIGKWVVKWKLAGRSYYELYWELIRQGERNREGNCWSMMTLWRMFGAECRLLQREPGGPALLARWQKVGLRRANGNLDNKTASKGAQTRP
jgi:DNA invertase Pin-like site-specific DNA recombinase